MARQFRDASGKIRNKRVYAGFRGTTRYVSINVHNRQEQVNNLKIIKYFIFFIYKKKFI